MLNYITINTSAEIICFIIAVICLRKDKSPVWRSMILFLLITCITELLGIYFKKHYLLDRVHNLPNLWLYNILLIFQAGFISLMFQHLIGKYVKSKLAIISGLALLVVLYIYELLKYGIFMHYSSLTNTVMLVLFILYSLFYYYCLLKEERYINLKYWPGFWWVAGILFFYFGSTVVGLVFGALKPDVALSLKTVSTYIFKSLNIIYYSCWAYSFICKRWLVTSQN